MSNLLFACSSCSAKLAVDGTLAGTAFTCPTCQKQDIIPQSVITMACQSCNQAISASANVRGEAFQCPHCSASVTVPAEPQAPATPALKPLSQLKPLQARPAAPKPPENVPAPSPSPEPPQHPGGQKTVPPDSANAITSNISRKADNSPATPVKEQPAETGSTGLRFKNTQLNEGALNPALSRFRKPEKATGINFRPFMKIAGIAAAVVCVAAGILYVVDLGTPDADTWSSAVQTLNALKADQADTASLSTLKNVITSLSKDKSSREAKAGLMAVWALGQINIRNDSQGLGACKWVQQSYSDTRFAGAVALSNFTQTCQSCRGNSVPCPACKGSGACPACSGNGNASSCPVCKGKNIIPCSSCKGTGQISSDSDAAAGKSLQSTGNRKIRRIGESATQDSSTKPTVQKCTTCKGVGSFKCPTCKGICPVCRGTNKCPPCRGTGKASAKCAMCGGAGCSISRESLTRYYPVLIDKALKPVKNRLMMEKVLSLLYKMQRTIKRSQPEDQPQTTGTSSNDLFSASETMVTPPSDQQGDSTSLNISSSSPQDWSKRYEELHKEYTASFAPPKAGEKISVRLTSGTAFEGKLISLTDSNLELRASSTDATLTFQSSQLSPESKAQLFCKDFAAYSAKKRCEEEKTKK